MKIYKTLSITIICFLYAVCSHSADWVLIQKNKDNSKSSHYYDAETIQRNGNYVTAWTKLTNMGLSRTDIYYMKRRFDCGAQRYQILYIKQFGEHPKQQDFHDNLQWITVSPDDQLNMTDQKGVCRVFKLNP